MSEPRKKREFWIAVEGVVSSEECLSTPSPSMWYSHNHGVSLTIGVHLFDKRVDANEQAHQYLDRLSKVVYDRRKGLVPRDVPIQY